MIRLDGKKDLSLVTWTIKRPTPTGKVRLFLKQLGAPDAEPCVAPGEDVLVGQKIAEPVGPKGVTVHASVSGKVVGLGRFPHPWGGLVEAIEIQVGFQQRRLREIGQERSGWEQLSPRELLSILQNSGIVGLSSLEPVHAKYQNGHPRMGDTLLINGCESEPYVTADHALMMAYPLEILKGAEILRRIANLDRVVLAIEDNKLQAAEILKSKVYFLKWNHFEIKVLPTQYPQGDDVILSEKVLGFDWRSQAIRGHSHVPVHNVATAFSVYEAVVMQKPLYERTVTVGGECVVDSANVWMPIGTLFQDAFKFCRGLLREPGKVVMNGPMRGAEQSDMAVAVIPATQAILALSKEVVFQEEIQPCIRCSRCVEACPVEISPVMITLAAEKEDFEAAQAWGSENCIACGNCSYVCPAKRPMVELIQYANAGLQRRNKSISVSETDRDRSKEKIPSREKTIFAETF